MRYSQIDHIIDALNYSFEYYEIHAWKLCIHDSKSIYYAMDYENPAGFVEEIMLHLLQYGIEAVELIHDTCDDDNTLLHYRIASIFYLALDEITNEEYIRLRHIPKDKEE